VLIISVLQVKHFMLVGCKYYLASIIATDAKEMNILTVPVVSEYLGVFSDELPDLPPPRDVEFYIKLQPSTMPVACAPYRMAPMEMRELKIQLKEIIQKGFICLRPPQDVL
jgi:hypothetical protein